MSAATMDGPTRMARGPGNFTHQRSKSTPHAMMHPYSGEIYGDGQLPSSAMAAYAGYAAALSRSGVAPEDALFRAALFAGSQQQQLMHQYPHHYPAANGATDPLKNLPPSALSSQLELLARAAAMNPYGFDPAAGAHGRLPYVPTPGMYHPEMAVPGASSLPQTPNYAAYNSSTKPFYFPPANGAANGHAASVMAAAAAAAQQYGLQSPDTHRPHTHTHSRKRTQSTDATATMHSSLITPITSPIKLYPFQDDQSSDSTTGGNSHDESDPAHFGTSANATPSSRVGPDRETKKLNLYKTELCRSWEETSYCRYGAKCQFAHSENELRPVDRHPKYKTEMCKTFWEKGTCPYGKRCCFIHTDRDVEKKMADIERRLIVIQDEKDDNGQVPVGNVSDLAPQRSQSVSAGGGPSGAAAAAAAAAAAGSITIPSGIMPGGHVRSKSLGAPRETVSMLRPQLEALAAYNSKPKSPFSPTEQQQGGSGSPSSIVAPTPTSMMMGMLSPTHHHNVHHPFVSPSREIPTRGPIGSRPSIHDGLFATPLTGPASASVLELGMMLKNVQISPSPVGSTASSGSSAILVSPTRIPEAPESLWEDPAPSLSSSLPAEDSSVFSEETRRLQHRRIQSVGSGRPGSATRHKKQGSAIVEQVFAHGDAAAAAEGSEEVDERRLAFFKNIA